jgi:hypothetical protein
VAFARGLAASVGPAIPARVPTEHCQSLWQSSIFDPAVFYPFGHIEVGAESVRLTVAAQLEASRTLIAKMSVSPGRIPALG